MTSPTEEEVKIRRMVEKLNTLNLDDNELEVIDILFSSALKIKEFSRKIFLAEQQERVEWFKKQMESDHIKVNDSSKESIKDINMRLLVDTLILIIFKKMEDNINIAFNEKIEVLRK